MPDDEKERKGIEVVESPDKIIANLARDGKVDTLVHLIRREYAHLDRMRLRQSETSSISPIPNSELPPLADPPPGFND